MAVAWSESAPTAPAMARYKGLRIHQLQFRGTSTLPAQKLLSIISLRAGEPLNPDDVRNSVQALYNTGYFADVQVEAEPAAQGQVTLTIATQPNYFIGFIGVNGAPKAPPSHTQLVAASKLNLGQLFTNDQLDQAVAGIKQVMGASGYQQSSIEPVLSRHPETQTIDITFDIHAGKPARVGRVQVTGDPGMALQEVQRISGLQKGARTGSARVTRALEKLRKEYQKQDRLEAQASVIHRGYEPTTNTENYTLNIDRGPLVDVIVEGARLRKGLIKKYVPIYQENAIDSELLNEGARNIRDYFQFKGFFDVVVSVEQKQNARDRVNVVYTVHLGQRHKLVAIVIDGNHYFDTGTLRDHMQIQPSSLTSPHGHYSQGLLATDAQSIENLYRANGFEQVSVRTETDDDYQGKRAHLRVAMHVDEGPQTRVASLHIKGNHAVSTDQIQGMISSTDGQPYSESNVAIDRETLLSYYFDRGFPDVQFESQVTQASANPPRVDVRYVITEGEQVRVNQVFVFGLLHTRPYVVNRQIELRAGDPLDQSAIIDTQRRLYDLGLFNEVDTAVQNPQGQVGAKNVLIQAEEARRYSFDYGFGFEVQTGSVPGNRTQPQGRTGWSPRVSLDVTRINFRGRDQTILFKSSYGRLEQLGLVSFEAPHLFNRDQLKLILTTFYDKASDVFTFTAQRLEGSVQLEQRFSTATLVLYGFVYRNVKVDPRTLEIDPNQIPLLSKPVRVGMPTFTYVRDTRDDPLDSHRGSYNALDAGVSAGAFGSEASFNRVLVTNSSYTQFHKKRWVFARNTQIGVENPYGMSSFIPLPERFYAGGANSLRGFSINQAGPRDLQTGFPVGGEGLFVNQFELRMPPLSLPFFGNDISPVIFHDAGNVFASAADIFPSMFRVEQRNKRQCELMTAALACDFNYFSHAVGGGLRYRTPIGPVRVDIGYDLNPPVFPIAEVDHFQVLRRVNFFFSLGQTF